jgi:hypothetical protein
MSNTGYFFISDDKKCRYYRFWHFLIIARFIIIIAGDENSRYYQILLFLIITGMALIKNEWAKF